MANYNSWTFAQSNWTALVTKSVLEVGYGDYSAYDDAYNADLYVYAYSESYEDELYTELTLFGFGQTYSDNSCYYYSLLNSNETIYGDYYSLAIFSLNFKGLGLPGPLFWEFGTLLSYITQGESYCYSGVGGYCVLTNACVEYPDLWNYTFQYAAEELGQNMIIPLATFAYDNDVGECTIMVEYLDNNSENEGEGDAIIFGSMFF